MSKKCLICDENAKFFIKGTSDFYCEECAIESFGDVKLLEPIEEQAKLLKKIIKESEDGFETNLSPQEEEMDIKPEKMLEDEDED